MNDDRLHIRPAEGQRVRRPDGRFLPDEGALVNPHPYWFRRLAKGDVVLVAVEIADAKTSKRKEN